MGSTQAAVMMTLGLYFLTVFSNNWIVLCGVPVLIGIKAGMAIFGRTIKEAVIKWVLSIPLCLIILLLVAKTQLSGRLFQQLNGYDRWSGDGVGIVLAISFSIFWGIVFMSISAWYSGSENKSGRKMSALFKIQAIPVNIVCLGLVVCFVVLNAVLPPLRAEIP